MATTTDFLSLGTSTATGALAGAPLGPVGAAVGAGLGFVSGLMGIQQNQAAADSAELQAQRSRLSTVELNKAREIERRMISVNAATQRRQLINQNAVQQANVRAAVAERGVAGGTAAQGARASVAGGLATNFQTNLLSEAVGIEISDIKQNAANIASGVTGPQASGGGGGGIDVKQAGKWLGDKAGNLIDDFVDDVKRGPDLKQAANWIGGLFN